VKEFIDSSLGSSFGGSLDNWVAGNFLGSINKCMEAEEFFKLLLFMKIFIDSGLGSGFGSSLDDWVVGNN
jgi:hypothetical protein